MTNYNDGQWHGWNGGECPVHPYSFVTVLYGDGGSHPELNAISFDWSGPEVLPSSYIAAFRVVKEHREPLEWWLTNGRVFSSAREAKTAYPGSNPVLVREVLE